MQVMAQLDEQRSVKLKRLQALTRLSVEEILSRGIDLVEQQQAERSRERSDAIIASDFVGCLQDAPEDLASNYRQYFAGVMQDEAEITQDDHGVG